MPGHRTGRSPTKPPHTLIPQISEGLCCASKAREKKLPVSTTSLFLSCTLYNISRVTYNSLNPEKI